MVLRLGYKTDTCNVVLELTWALRRLLAVFLVCFQWVFLTS